MRYSSASVFTAAAAVAAVLPADVVAATDKFELFVSDVCDHLDLKSVILACDLDSDDEMSRIRSVSDAAFSSGRHLAYADAGRIADATDDGFVLNLEEDFSGVVLFPGGGDVGYCQDAADLAAEHFTTTFVVPHICDDLMEGAHLRLDSLVYFYGGKDGDVNFTLTESYSVRGSKVSGGVLSWSEAGGVVPEGAEAVFDRRSDLGNITLVNTLLDSNYAVVYVKGDDDEYLPPEGFFISVIETLAKKMNFSMKYIPSRDKKWGSVDANGTWNGMVSMLMDGSADLCTAELTITLERSRVIDYTLPLDRDVLTLTAVPPTGFLINPWVYLEIFHWETWLAVCCSLAGLAAAATAVAVAGSERFHAAGDPERFGPLNAAAMQLVLFLQRDYSASKRSAPARVVFQASCMFGFLVFAFYTGVLTSLMTSRPAYVPITEMSQVLTSDIDYRLIVMGGTSHESTVKTSPPGTPMYDIHAELVAGNEENVFVYSRQEALDRMESDPRYLYFGSKMFWLLHSQVETLKLRDYLYGNLAFGLGKDSELRQMFNYHLIRMDETGLTGQLRREWLLQLRGKEKGEGRDDFEEVNGGGGGAETLGYDNLVAPFVGLAAGSAAAATVVAAEWLSRTCRKREKAAKSPPASYTLSL